VRHREITDRKLAVDSGLLQDDMGDNTGNNTGNNTGDNAGDV
jgi:hypothetical protein